MLGGQIAARSIYRILSWGRPDQAQSFVPESQQRSIAPQMRFSQIYFPESKLRLSLIVTASERALMHEVLRAVEEYRHREK